MLNESRSRPGPEIGLIPLERVAMPTHETTDKATRKMIAQIQTTLGARFSLELDGTGVQHHDMRFVSLRTPRDNLALRASLRTTNKGEGFQPRQSLELIAGMCFFGAEGLTGSTKRNETVSLTDPLEMGLLSAPIQEIEELKFLHISEASSILRTTKALQFLAAAQEPNTAGPMRCSFHLPVVEYQLYMLEMVEKGVLSPDQFSELQKRIKARATALQKLVARRVAAEIELSFFTPLQALDALLEKKQAATRLNECLAILQQDPILKELCFLLPPRGLLDLPNLSYSAAYLQLSQRAQKNGKGFLAVETAEEGPIFEHAKRLATQIGEPLNMSALYLPAEMVSRQGRNGKDAPFMHQSRGASALEELKLIVKNTKNGGTCQNLR